MSCSSKTKGEGDAKGTNVDSETKQDLTIEDDIFDDEFEDKEETVIDDNKSDDSDSKKEETDGEKDGQADSSDKEEQTSPDKTTEGPTKETENDDERGDSDSAEEGIGEGVGIVLPDDEW